MPPLFKSESKVYSVNIPRDIDKNLQKKIAGVKEKVIGSEFEER